MTGAPRFEHLQLAAEDAELALVPAAGGAIASWRVGGQPMLHESHVAAGLGWNPLDMACFPLVPFSNRIGHGTFMWDGEQYQLPPSALPDGHSLHGVGWIRAWEVADRGAGHAALRHRHKADHNWPWPYAAEQHFRLTPTSLEIELRVINHTDRAVPLAIGLHPYFDAAGAHLRFAATQVWDKGGDMLPTCAITPEGATDFMDGRAVAGTGLDNGYDGWDGRAAIWWDERPRALRIASDLPCAVVYTPPSSDYFCFEPVPHSNNALNMADAGQAMPVVAAREAFSAHVHFEVAAREEIA